MRLKMMSRMMMMMMMKRRRRTWMMMVLKVKLCSPRWYFIIICTVYFLQNQMTSSALYVHKNGILQNGYSGEFYKSSC